MPTDMSAGDDILQRIFDNQKFIYKLVGKMSENETRKNDLIQLLSD
jgi:hypothetical protein